MYTRCVLFAVLGLNRVPLWGTAIISFGSGIVCAIIVRLFVVPWQRKRIRSESICSVTLPDFSGDPRLFCLCCLWGCFERLRLRCYPNSVVFVSVIRAGDVVLAAGKNG